MPEVASDLWRLVLDNHEVDPTQLAEAIADQVGRNDLDFRSRLLIRDSLNALEQRWGPQRVQAWLRACPVGPAVDAVWHEDLGEPGFPSLEGRIVEPTRPETIRQLFREVGTRLRVRKR